MEKTTNKQLRYFYEGPVFHFEHIITNKHQDHTTAPTMKKALSNLTFKAKGKYGYAKNAKITLVDKYLHLVED